MKSASSTPGRILPELNHFLGSLQSAGPHRGFTNKCPIPLCHLLSLLAREEGPTENTAEPWGFSRTKEAEVVQEVLGECPCETIFFLKLSGEAESQCLGFGWCPFLLGGRGMGQIGGMAPEAR